jgi:hypothetical protein
MIKVLVVGCGSTGSKYIALLLDIGVSAFFQDIDRTT